MVQNGRVTFTNEECRRLRADALLECEEAELDLSRLLVVARQLGEIYRQIGVGLSGLSSVNDTGNAEHSVVELLERHRDRLNGRDVEALITSVLAARTRLKNARRDKASLQVS
jgi:hypothetical protein